MVRVHVGGCGQTITHGYVHAHVHEGGCIGHWNNFYYHTHLC